MIGLYDYDSATEQECLDDLQEVIEYLLNYNLCDLDDIEKKGLRIQYIAQRLKNWVVVRMNREQAFFEAQLMFGKTIKELKKQVAELQKQLEEKDKEIRKLKQKIHNDVIQDN